MTTSSNLFLPILFMCMMVVACGSSSEPVQASADIAPVSQVSEADPPQPDINPAVRPAIQSYEIIATYPHDTSAFTQGLFFHEGKLYESTGKYGKSTIRRTEIETGTVEQFRDLPPEYFGEGIARWNDKIIALTWRAGLGFIIDLETLAPEDAFDYIGEGWGLTANNTNLIQSDGSPILRFLDPETLQITSTLIVRLNGKPLEKLNELEWINGEIWANVWESDLIVRIDPESGNVISVIDFTGLFPESEREHPNEDVLNGIAHDPETGRLFVTGKHWPNLYEIRVTDIGALPQ